MMLRQPSSTNGLLGRQAAKRMTLQPYVDVSNMLAEKWRCYPPPRSSSIWSRMSLAFLQASLSPSAQRSWTFFSCRDSFPTFSSLLRMSRPRFSSDSDWLVVRTSVVLDTIFPGAVTTSLTAPETMDATHPCNKIMGAIANTKRTFRPTIYPPRNNLLQQI